MEMTNLFGTTLLGHTKLSEKELEKYGLYSDKEFHPYIATKWFVLLIPLIPLKSYIVTQQTTLYGGGILDDSVGIQYQLIELNFQWKQVLRIYASLGVSLTVIVVGLITLSERLACAVIIIVMILAFLYWDTFA